MSHFKNKDQLDNKPLSWRYFDREGVPLEAESPPLWTSDEYYSKTRRAGKSGVGVFDVVDLDQRRCGRTYREILDAVSVGEFVIVSTDTKWVEQESGEPPKMFVYVSWYELRDVPTSEIRRRSEQRPEEQQ